MRLADSRRASPALIPSMRLDGRHALITGAGRGIGAAAAAALAEAGAVVTLVARSQDEIDVVCSDIRAAGGSASAIQADVSDVVGFSKIVSDLRFDILVNNAGTNRPRPLVDVAIADFDTVMSLNVRAAYFAMQAVARGMIGDRRSGSIINISSQMGHVGAANRSIYCASKWAMEGMTKAAAIELAPHNIRVNTIAPTFVETPMTKSFFADKAFLENTLSKIKLGRLAQPSDITGAIVFLASEASAMMTGSSIVIDGGWTAD